MDSFRAKELCRQKQYQAVLTMYQNGRPNASWTCWDYYYYAYALQKTKHYAKGHEIARLGMIAFPQFTRLHLSYCWCLYYLYIQKYDEKRDDPRQFRRAVDAILQYSLQESYSPYTLTVWKVVSSLRGRPGHTATEISRYLEKLDPDLLSEEEGVRKENGRTVQTASEKERWYSLRSRFLVKEGQYETCISLLRQRVASYQIPVPTWDILLDTLYPFWISCRHAGEDPMYGTIETILPGHAGGFIKMYTGTAYYFKTTSVYRTEAVRGLYVSFYVQEGRKGPQETAKRAIDIMPATQKTYGSMH